MNVMKTIGLTLAGVMFVLFGAATAQADNIYFSVRGMKQGPFKGEVLQKGFEGKMAGLKFHYEVVSPRDVATGMPSGKRQHKPIVITKEWGAASPQLFQALVTNEVLPEVVIDFVGADPIRGGVLTLSHSIKLTNATIADISHSTEPIASGGVRHIEDVSLTFQKIELTDVKGNTMAMDSLVP